MSKFVYIVASKFFSFLIKLYQFDAQVQTVFTCIKTLIVLTVLLGWKVTFAYLPVV